MYAQEAQHETVFAILDAARDYMRIGIARLLVGTAQSLFEGPKGQRLDDVAPYLVCCDTLGQVAELILAPDKEGECGIVLDSQVDFASTRRHLRRFLVVRRARDMKKVLFRFYDPRVLRVFLPVCTETELLDFFGPITAFHCQGD